MTYIYKFTLNHIPNSRNLHVGLSFAQLDDETNGFFDGKKPREVAQGYLDDIESLVMECGNTFKQVKSEVFRNEHLGGSPVPDNDIPQLPQGMITNRSDEENVTNETSKTELSSTRIKNLLALLDAALENGSLRTIRDAFLRHMPNDNNETVRISISTNYALIQFLPIENTKFIQEVLGRNRTISVIFDPLIL
jgi:predicted  nucleic acid-binding Zn-ribbon protein